MILSYLTNVYTAVTQNFFWDWFWGIYHRTQVLYACLISDSFVIVGLLLGSKYFCGSAMFSCFFKTGRRWLFLVTAFLHRILIFICETVSLVDAGFYHWSGHSCFHMLCTFPDTFLGAPSHFWGTYTRFWQPFSYSHFTFLR